MRRAMLLLAICACGSLAGAQETPPDRLGAAFHLLPECGHVPFVEAFEPFVSLLDAFLPRTA